MKPNYVGRYKLLMFLLIYLNLSIVNVELRQIFKPIFFQHLFFFFLIVIPPQIYSLYTISLIEISEEYLINCKFWLKVSRQYPEIGKNLANFCYIFTTYSSLDSQLFNNEKVKYRNCLTITTLFNCKTYSRAQKL